MKNYRNNFGFIILRFLSIIGLCRCLMPTEADSDSYNGTNFAFGSSENFYEMNPSLSFQPNSRTPRRGNNLANGCTTNDGAPGTCMSRFNCMRQGGTAKGFCTTFGGVCCETNLQCGQTSRLKRTIIRNPTQLPTGDCFYEIESYNSNVCQLLVEFNSFELQQPTLTGNDLECTDYMEIHKYKLCGSNTQQHLYVPFNAGNGITSVPLVFHVPSRWPQTNWRLTITQLECPAVKRRMNLSFLPFITDNSLQDARTVISTHNSDLELLAPPGCDQYFRQTAGTIRTFNYNENLNSLYMKDLHYVICVKASNGATVIEYVLRRFSLSVQNTQLAPFDSNCFALVNTPSRREDYLSIPQSEMTLQGTALRPTYYCGNSFPSGSLITASAPFVMYFNSDGFTDATETGFSIDYRVKSVLG